MAEQSKVDLEEINRQVARRMGTSVRRYASDTSHVGDMLNWIAGRAKVPGIVRMKNTDGTEGAWRWGGGSDGPCLACCLAVLSVPE